MSYFKNKGISYAYNNDSVLFETGPNKDSYSINTHYQHDVETDIITYRAEVVKNWSYNEAPKEGVIGGKKYRETISSGTLKQCLEFIDNIAKAQGYWERHPTQPFEKIFIEPII